jgi:triphosphoribosyl-dephospho-CoA synthase
MTNKIKNISELKVDFQINKLEKSYINACRLDIDTIKPGNVNTFLGHHDTQSDDFISSYSVTSKIIISPNLSLGDKIFNCIKSTNKSVNKNTNLGIILLCSLFSHSLSIKKNIIVKDAIKECVLTSSRDDVLKICKAISLAQPGGLNMHDEYDVDSRPDISLYNIMKLSSSYDMISKQYSCFFEDIFDFILPTLIMTISEIKDVKLAISYTFLKTLEKYPDSHICRKYDDKFAKKTSNEASDLIKILDGDARLESWGKKLMSLDNHFKMARVNPGTTADLLVVSMMIYDYFIGIPKK